MTNGRLVRLVGPFIFSIAFLGACSDPSTPGSTAIGPAGGTVVGDGARVAVPEGAVASSVDLGVAAVTSGYPALPAQVSARGPVIALTPHGQSFAVPVTIRIPISETTAEPMLLTAPLDGEWTEVVGAARDGDAMTADVEHFSFFVVAEGTGPEVDGGTEDAGPAPTDGGPALTDAGLADDGGDSDAALPSDGGGSDAGPPAPPPGELVVASGFDYATGHVRVDATHVYWTGFSLSTDGGIRRVPLGGGAVETLVSGTPPIWGFALTDSGLFFSTETAIFSAPLAGGTPALHASHAIYYSDGDLVPDATDLYWPGRHNGLGTSVARVTRSGSTCTFYSSTTDDCSYDPCASLGGGRQPYGCTDLSTGYETFCCLPLEDFAAQRGFSSGARRLVLSGGYAYWTENNSSTAWVLRRPLAGGSLEVLLEESVTSTEAFRTIAASSTRVYFFDSRSGGAIRSMPLAGGTPVVEATGTIQQLAADATHLYFTGTVSAGMTGVFRLPLAGGAVEAVASTDEASDLILTDTHVYWVGSASGVDGVYRIAK